MFPKCLLKTGDSLLQRTELSLNEPLANNRFNGLIPNSKLALFLHSFALGLAGLLALAGCDRIAGKNAAPTFHFTDITGAEFARKLDLPDVDGKPRSLADWKGKVAVVFFGYTQCPDVCPTTMAELAQIRKLLGADGDKLQTVFVTIDPERDTRRDPEGLRRQLRSRRRRLARQRRADGRRGQGVQGLLRQGGRARRPAATPWTTAPPRSSSIRSGRVRLFVPYGGDPKILAADIKQLARGGARMKSGPSGAGPSSRRKGSAAGREQPCSKKCAERARAARPRAASALRIFFIAATSIWRMRSALTPYSPARSCSVMPPELSSLTLSQRSSTIRRLRASSESSARAMPSPASQSRFFASITRVGSLRVVGQVGDRRVAFLAVVGLRLERDVAAREAGFHLEDFLALDVQALGQRVDLALGQGRAVRVLVLGVVLQRLLHRAQVEEELPLRLGRRDLDHAPVLQDVLVDLGLDPVHGVADQANALVGVEALHGLHQADVAFLDQVAVRQAVAEVLARDRDDQAQVRDDQATGGGEVAVVAQAAGELGLLLLGQKGDAVDGTDVGVEVAQGGHERPRIPDGERIGTRSGS